MQWITYLTIKCINIGKNNRKTSSENFSFLNSREPSSYNSNKHDFCLWHPSVVNLSYKYSLLARIKDTVTSLSWLVLSHKP